MLVLSRRPLETIVLSNGAVFKVLGIERGRVRIGVAAPEGVRILRGEHTEAPSAVDTARPGNCRRGIDAVAATQATINSPQQSHFAR